MFIDHDQISVEIVSEKVDVKIKTTPAPSTALKCAKKCRQTEEIPVSVVFEHASGSGLFMERTHVSSRCGTVDRKGGKARHKMCHFTAKMTI